MKRMSKQYRCGWAWLLLLPGLALHAEEARLQWANTTTLSTLVSGEVAEVRALPGQRVKQGESLLRLSPEVFDTQLAAARAIVKNRGETRTESKAQYTRAKEMFDNSMLSDHELELARLDHARAETAYQQALGELAVAEQQSRQSQLKAPFNALITAVHVRVGEVVNSRQASSALVELVSSERMLAVAELELEQALALTPGSRLPVKLKGRSVEGILQAIRLPVASAGSSLGQQQAVIEVELPVKAGIDALPGQAVTVDLP